MTIHTDHIYIYTYLYIDRGAFECMHYAYIHTYIHTCIPTYIHVYNTYIHAYIHTHNSARTHTHT